MKTLLTLLLVISVEMSFAQKNPVFLFYAHGFGVTTADHVAAGSFPKPLKVYIQNQKLIVGERMYKIKKMTPTLYMQNGSISEYQCVDEVDTPIVATYTIQRDKNNKVVFGELVLQNHYYTTTYVSRRLEQMYRKKN